jgi:hypothetical protein
MTTSQWAYRSEREKDRFFIDQYEKLKIHMTYMLMRIE